MQYLSYDEYVAMGGKLSQAEFNRYRLRAQCEMDNVTFGRLKNVVTASEKVKGCMFELITYLSNTAKEGSALAVSSFGNDGYSVSYAEQNTAAQQISDIIYTYLADTDLLYCGVE